MSLPFQVTKRMLHVTCIAESSLINKLSFDIEEAKPRLASGENHVNTYKSNNRQSDCRDGG